MKPFQSSLAALAQIATYETGADGYAYFLRILETRVFVRQDSAGGVIADDVLAEVLRPGSQTASAVIAYPLDTEAVLAFSFQDSARCRDARPRLDRIAGTIEAVWRAANTFEKYTKLAYRVAELEASLMDSKIADRARGFLVTPGQDPIEAIARHAERVLRETSTRRLLQQISGDLEEEVEERHLVGRAKAILQSSQELSEEAAHAHLRLVSRKSRRRLKDVAREVIEQTRMEEPCITK